MGCNVVSERVNKKTDQQTDPLFDRELKEVPAEWQWREWMNRVEAVIFASGTVVDRQ